MTLSLGLLALSIVLSFALAIVQVRHREARMRLTPDAAYSDLYARWRGTRDLLSHGQNPYTPEATLENEQGQYGRPLGPGRAVHDPSGFQGFSYPLHVAVLLAPLSLVSFDVLRPIATATVAGFVLWSTYVWASLIGWPSSARTRVLVAVAATASLPAVDLISLQQLSGLVLVSVVASAGALRVGRPGWAGAILALATIKPQLVALLCLGLAVWALRDQRPAARRFLGAFVATTVCLGLGSLALMPDWPMWFVWQAVEYSKENRLVSLIGLLPSSPVRIAGGAVVILFTLATFDRASRGRHGEVVPVQVIATGLAASLLILPLASIYDRVFLIPGLLVLFGSGIHRSPGAAGILMRLTIAMYLAALASAAIGYLLAAPRLLGYDVLESLVLPGKLAQVFPTLLILALPAPVWLALVCANRPWGRLGAAAGIVRRRATYSR